MAKLLDATRVKFNLQGARRIYAGSDLAWEFQPWLDGDGTANRRVSTPNAPDLIIDGDVRWTTKLRDDSAESATTRIAATKFSPGYAYKFGQTYLAAFDVLGYPAGVNTPQLQVIGRTRTLLGLTPPGTDRYVGTIVTGVTPGSSGTTNLRGQMIESVDGVTWTAAGAQSAAIRSDAMSAVTTDPLWVGYNWIGRTYWAQMEAINRARLVFPGILFNVLTVPDAPNLNVTGNIQVTCRCERPASGPTTQRVVSKDTNNATGNRGWAVTWSGGQIGFIMLPSNSILSSVTVPVANGEMVWIRCTRANSTGVCTLEWAPDSPTEPTTGWTTLPTTGTPLVGAVPVTTGAVRIGDRSTTPVDPLDPYAGRVARVIIRDGTTVVLDVNENNAATMTGSTFTATTGQTVTVNDSSAGAYLAGQLANVSTTDPGVLPNSFVLVYRALNTGAAGFPIHAAQTTGSDPRSYSSYVTLVNTRILWDATPDGVWANRQSRYADRPIPPLNVARTEAIAITQNSAGRHLMTAWTYDDATATWTARTTRDTGTALTAFDVATTLVLGGGFVKGERLYSAEMRTGTDPRAGTVVWRFDAGEFPGGAGLSYSDPRGRTWTLTAANSIIAKAPAPIVQKQADRVVWRFDAKDYPGTGTTYVDPRGRTWTLSAAGAVAVP